VFSLFENALPRRMSPPYLSSLLHPSALLPFLLSKRNDALAATPFSLFWSTFLSDSSGHSVSSSPSFNVVLFSQSIFDESLFSNTSVFFVSRDALTDFFFVLSPLRINVFLSLFPPSKEFSFSADFSTTLDAESSSNSRFVTDDAFVLPFQIFCRVPRSVLFVLLVLVFLTLS